MAGVEGLPDRIRRELRQRGLTDRGFADEAARLGYKVSNSTASDWLNGERQLGTRMRTAVSLVLGWPMDWPENTPPESIPPEIVSQLDRVEARQQEQAEALNDILDLLRGVAAAVRQLQGANGSPRSSAKPKP